MMLDRNSIAAAIRFALGRPPDEVAYMGCQAAFQNINGLVENLICSDEFKSRSWHLAAARSRSAISERSAWRGDAADIEWAYKAFLGRAPENYSVIAAWSLEAPTREQVAEAFLTSDEFKSNAWHQAAKRVRARFTAPGIDARPAVSSNMLSRGSTLFS
jgi:hypothetical protein